VGIDGAKEEAVDLKKATRRVRMLSTSSLVYGSTGYEADSDKNSVGGATETYSSDTGFPEVVTAGAGYYTSSVFMLAIMLISVLFA